MVNERMGDLFKSIKHEIFIKFLKQNNIDYDNVHHKNLILPSDAKHIIINKDFISLGGWHLDDYYILYNISEQELAKKFEKFQLLEFYS